MRNMDQYPITHEEKIAVVEKLRSDWIKQIGRHGIGMGDITGMVLLAIHDDYAIQPDGISPDEISQDSLENNSAKIEEIIRSEVGDACYDDIRWRSTREVVEACVQKALRTND